MTTDSAESRLHKREVLLGAKRKNRQNRLKPKSKKKPSKSPKILFSKNPVPLADWLKGKNSPR
jgi:hypothetical protein